MIITYTSPPDLRESIVVHGDLALVGRPSPDWKIDINLSEDKAVSRLHAAISLAGGEFWVEDLGSSNGTLIDGKKISNKTLIPLGAKLTIGRTILEIRHDETPLAAAQSQTGLYGDIAEMVDAAQPPFFTLRDTPDSDALSYAVRQLEALHDLGRELGSADTIDGLLDSLRNHVQHAIPAAQRGAVLLSNEQGKLLMKAHWPAGQHSVSMTWATRASEERQAFIWSADHKEHRDIPQTALLYKVKCAIYVPLIWEDEVFGVVYVDSFVDRQAFKRADLDLLRTIAEQTAMFIEINLLQSQLRDEERVQASLLRQFSPHMVQRLLEDQGRLRLGGERADPVTVLMADVRGFTVLSAQMEPDVLVQMLNEMYSAHIPIIS